MAETIDVYINETRVTVIAGSTVHAAVAVHDDHLARAVESGSAYVTDGVGRRMSPDTTVGVGEIVRVVRTARRLGDGEAIS